MAGDKFGLREINLPEGTPKSLDEAMKFEDWGRGHHFSPGGQGRNAGGIQAFAGHGADAGKFAQAMESFAVSGQMRRALQFTQRTGVDATPTMIVNGKYRVVSGQDFQDVLRIVDYLVEQERAAAATGDDAAAEAVAETPAAEAPAADEAAADAPAEDAAADADKA